MFLRKILLPGMNTIDDTLSLIYQQLSVMLTAGIPVTEALDILIEESDKKQIRRILTALKSDLQKDASPGEKFVTHRKYYTEAIVYALKNSSLNSNPSKHLTMIADEFERMGDIKRKIRSSLIYPISLISIALICLTVILIFVVPVFQEMYSDFGEALPGQTQLVVSLSDFLKNYIHIMVIAFAVTISLTIKLRKQLTGPATYIPFIGKILNNISMMQFTKNLSMMLSANAPIKVALQYSAASMDNPLFSKKIRNIGDSITSFSELKQAIQSDTLFPRILSQVMASGEKAQLPGHILFELSRYYQKNVDQSVNRFISITDVLIFIITGITIGWIVIALYQPIFSMGGVLSG